MYDSDCEFDSDTATISSNCSRIMDELSQIDKILEQYENAANDEKYYLLQSSFEVMNSHCELRVGISPARSFSPIIILKSQVQKIVLSTYEWMDLIEVLTQIQKDFFTDDYELKESNNPPIRCGDFLHVSKLMYEDTKQVMVMKHLYAVYLSDYEVNEILKMDLALIRTQLNLLKDIEFCKYYYNMLNIVRKWFATNKTVLSAYEILCSFCECSNSLCSNALKQYLFYYKDSIITDLNI